MNKIRLLFALALLVAACVGSLRAQVNAYTFRSAADLTALQYTQITDGRTIAATDSCDDQLLRNIPVGFDFPFAGRTVNALVVSANGFVCVEAEAVAGLAATSPISTGFYRFVISPFGADLKGSRTGRIVVRTSGDAPNRVFTVQWQNWLTSDVIATLTNQPPDTLNFQVRLEENGGISFGYGQMGLSQDIGAFDIEVGLLGASSADFHNRAVVSANSAVNDPWSASARGTKLDAKALYGAQRFEARLLGAPRNGLVYAFMPPGSMSSGMMGGGMMMGGMMGGMTTAPLTAPVAASPANEATLGIPGEIRWQPVQGATSYRVSISGAQDGSNPLVNTLTSNTSLNISSNDIDATAGLNYFWRVQAVRNNGSEQELSGQSEVRRFVSRPLPRIRTMSERMFQQGVERRVRITADNIMFGNAANVVFVRDSGNASGNARITPTQVNVESSTSLQVTVRFPSDAQAGSYGVSIIAGSDTIRQASVLTVYPESARSFTNSFDPLRHGFKFANAGENMWNRSIWGSIDYSSAAFPPEIQEIGKQADFPSWDDFVPAYERRYGRSAFTDANRRNPRRDAVSNWRAKKTKWGGSCNGFAVTAASAWAGRYAFDREANQYDVTPNLRALINRNQIFQDNPKTGREDDGTPNSAVRQILESWNLPRNQHFLIGIYNIRPDGSSGGGHALFPFRIGTGTAANGDIIDSVFSYDMNFPNIKDSAIVVNRTRNTWFWWGLTNSDERNGDSPWQGSESTNSLNADGTVATAFSVNIPNGSISTQASSLLASGKGNTAQTHSENSTENDDLIPVFFSDDDESTTASTPRVTLTNRINQSIESIGVLAQRPAIPTAEVIRPIATGADVIVQGFNLPIFSAEQYRLNYTATKRTVTNLITSTVRQYGFLTVFGNNPANTGLIQPFSLSPNTPQDFVRISSREATRNGVLAVWKSDPSDTVWTNYIQLSNVNLSANDSVDVRLTNDGAAFTVTNYGTAKTVALYMERFDSTSFPRVNLPARSASTFSITNLNNLRACDILVRLDIGLNGKTDSAYYLRRNGVVSSVKAQSADIASMFHVNVYPNPASNLASVDYVILPEMGAQRVRVELLDMLGRRVATGFDGIAGVGRNSASFNLESLANGLYICRVSIGDRTETRLLNVRR